MLTHQQLQNVETALNFEVMSDKFNVDAILLTSSVRHKHITVRLFGSKANGPTQLTPIQKHYLLLKIKATRFGLKIHLQATLLNTEM